MIPKVSCKIRNQRLKIIQQQILKEPHQFQMDALFSSLDSTNECVNVNCRTAACIAGWAFCLFGFKESIKPATGRNRDKNFPNGFSRSWIRAEELLGLNAETSHLLFVVHDWPIRFRNAYRKAINLDAHKAAQVAARRISHFIKTGK